MIVLEILIAVGVVVAVVGALLWWALLRPVWPRIAAQWRHEGEEMARLRRAQQLKEEADRQAQQELAEDRQQAEEELETWLKKPPSGEQQQDRRLP